MLKDALLLLFAVARREQCELSLDLLIVSFSEGLGMTNCKSRCFMTMSTQFLKTL